MLRKSAARVSILFFSVSMRVRSSARVRWAAANSRSASRSVCVCSVKDDHMAESNLNMMMGTKMAVRMLMESANTPMRAYDTAIHVHPMSHEKSNELRRVLGKNTWTMIGAMKMTATRSAGRE
jgi:hypothetical protein